MIFLPTCTSPAPQLRSPQDTALKKLPTFGSLSRVTVTVGNIHDDEALRPRPGALWGGWTLLIAAVHILDSFSDSLIALWDTFKEDTWQHIYPEVWHFVLLQRAMVDFSEIFLGELLWGCATRWFQDICWLVRGFLMIPCRFILAVIFISWVRRHDSSRAVAM